MLLAFSIIIIITGSILLIIGIIYGIQWNTSFQQLIMRENTILNNIVIDPSKSISASVYVSDQNRLLTLVIDPDNNSMGVLKEKIIDPNQSVISEKSFSEDFIYSIKPTTEGTYTVIISNDLTRPVTVSVLFGYFPADSIVGSKSLFELTTETLSIIFGLILIISGIIIRVAFMIKKSA